MLFESALISKASGSIGGVTGSRNRFGMYFRSRSNPVNPNSDRQIDARSRMAQLASAWNEQLTAAQRSLWNSYAAAVPIQNKLGATIYLTGFNHFCRSNAVKLQVESAYGEDAPSLYTLPEQDPTFSVAYSEASQLITVTFDDTLDWCSEDDAHMVIHMGIPKLNDVNFFGGPWRYAASLDGDSTTPITSPQTVAVPFTIGEGQKVWTRGRILRADLRLSNFFRGFGTVAA